jgi:hypothetical protein
MRTLANGENVRGEERERTEGARQKSLSPSLSLRFHSILTVFREAVVLECDVIAVQRSAHVLCGNAVHCEEIERRRNAAIETAQTAKEREGRVRRKTGEKRSIVRRREEEMCAKERARERERERERGKREAN